MSSYLLAILFGIVEGVTEFLPISSTAHLRLLKPIFGIDLADPYWKMFDIVIQLGAVLCLPVYFRRRITSFIRTFPKGTTGDHDAFTHPLTLVMIASVITLGLGLAMEKLIASNLEREKVIGAALLIGGAVMWAIDATFNRPRTQDINDMNLLQVVWVGLVQVLAAIFPGTSRSMATIAAGQVAGLSRPAALEFSFFVSMPVMGVACAYKLLKTIRPGHLDSLPAGTMNAHLWITLAIGFIVSFIVALVVVAWFMNWVRRRGFVPFAVYRILLGSGVLLYW